MPDTVNNAIHDFLSQIKMMLGDQFSKMILYGSYARGDYQSNSDVDILILAKMSESEIKVIENEIFDLAFDVEMETGVDISPIVKNEDHYMYWADTLPFYKNIKEEGVLISG
ncbi:nucleotidyltransferase domain-containing protein [bacterium]|nr:nucleotidyltransferase domain-containing protein [bacterium]